MAGTFNAFLASLAIPGLSGPDTAKRRVDWLNTESVLFSDVLEKNAAGRIVLPKNLDLPMAFSHYRFNSPPGTGEILMRMENGDPFLTAFYPGNGKTYLVTVPLDENTSNFPRHPVFVPVMERMALLSRTGSQLFYYTGQNTPAAVPGDTLSSRPVYKLSRPGDDFEIIPEVRNTGPSVLIYPRGQVLEAGIYSLALNDKPAGLLAFNYDRAESDPELYSSDEITSILRKDQIKYFALLKDNKTPVSKQVRELQQGTPLWKLFLLVALLFIATEIAIIRIMR
jgi:hypothetical protein